jgi:hypothetical protein
MTENELDMHTISTKQTDKHADCFLQLEQVTEKKETASPSQNQMSYFFSKTPITRKL